MYREECKEVHFVAIASSFAPRFTPTRVPPQSAPEKLWHPSPLHLLRPISSTHSFTTISLYFMPVPVKNFRWVCSTMQPEDTKSRRRMKTSVSGEQTHISCMISSYMDARTYWGMNVSASSCEWASWKLYPWSLCHTQQSTLWYWYQRSVATTPASLLWVFEAESISFRDMVSFIAGWISNSVDVTALFWSVLFFMDWSR